MSVRDLEGYLKRVEEIKNTEKAFMERMHSQRLEEEERYASPERKKEIQGILRTYSEKTIDVESAVKKVELEKKR